MKDIFSANADKYSKFRPTYPRELFDFLLPLVRIKDKAWDCGTGNGQVAGELALHFDKVYATDISERQLTNAVKASNIYYSVEAAEGTSFLKDMFDLVTVAQAVHWFRFDDFYKEAVRVLKPSGILAVIGYGLIRVDEKIDSIVDNFYYDIIGPYWDKERKYIDEHYQTIPFPFKEMQVPQLYNDCEWTLEQLMGYIGTWSAVQHYEKIKATDPIELMREDLQKVWSVDEVKRVRFPILLRVGQV